MSFFCQSGVPNGRPLWTLTAEQSITAADTTETNGAESALVTMVDALASASTAETDTLARQEKGRPISAPTPTRP